MTQPTSPTRSVLIIETGSLLEEGIQRLLAQEADLRVSGVMYTEEAVLLQDIARICPDVIVLNETGPLASAQAFEMLEAVANGGNLSVIVVRSDNNTIDVYEKRSTTVTKSGDLLALVRGVEDRA